MESVPNVFSLALPFLPKNHSTNDIIYVGNLPHLLTPSMAFAHRLQVLPLHPTLLLPFPFLAVLLGSKAAGPTMVPNCPNQTLASWPTIN